MKQKRKTKKWQLFKSPPSCFCSKVEVECCWKSRSLLLEEISLSLFLSYIDLSTLCWSHNTTHSVTSAVVLFLKFARINININNCYFSIWLIVNKQTLKNSHVYGFFLQLFIYLGSNNSNYAYVKKYINLIEKNKK